MSAALRHAEKARRSSCAFADTVASMSIAAYRREVPPELQAAYRQTVLAAVLLQGPLDDVLEVISLGVGTKALSLELLLQSEEQARIGGGSDKIRDMHAEVLARRGLLSWLYRQLELGSDSPYLEKVTSPAPGPGQAPEARSFLRLRAGYSLHMYSSSQPCGNACIKKWGKSKRPGAELASLGPFCCPLLEHPKFHVTARKEGQVAALVKSAVAASEEPEEEAENEGGGTLDSSTGNGGKRAAPPGTAYPDSVPLQGLVLSCSDKLLVWNCLGLQGGLLSTWLEPLYLRSLTVGRKFSQVHCERALCCRAAACFSPFGPFAVNHPAMLCSSVRFDDTVFDTSAAFGFSGAVFSEKRCFVWEASRSAGEVLDGATGKLFDSPAQSSTFSSAFLFQRYKALSTCIGPSAHAQKYQAAKKAEGGASSYDAAKTLLFSPPSFLFEYRPHTPRHHNSTA